MSNPKSWMPKPNHVRTPIDQRDLVEDETVNEEVVETELIEDAEMAESEPETTSAVTEATDEQRDSESEATDSVVEMTEDEEGKDVLGPDGQTVGMVNTVEDGVIYLEPNPGITDRLTTGLGWGSDEEGTTIETEQIEEIGSNSVRLSPVGEEELEEGRS